MAHTRLCVTVAARTMTDLRARRDALPGAELVELRLDTVDRPDVAGALAGRRSPVLVTCRPTWEGGFFQGTEDERLAILERALERHRYNRTAAGASLGLSLRQMRYRMARLGVGAVDGAAERGEGA